MFASHRWLAVVCFALVAPCWAMRTPPPRHNDAYRWATKVATRLISEGVPEVLGSSGDTAVMMTAAIGALWDIVPRLERDTNFVEMFAGECGVTHCIRDETCLVAFSFDRRHATYQDATRLQGMLYAFFLVSTLAVGAGVHFSPECSTWINMCVGHTRRCSDDPLGCDLRGDVLEANHVAMIVSLG
eukprot:9504181-Pyramimonas_sp.AAC.1